MFEVDCKVKLWYLLEMLFSKDKKIKKEKEKKRCQVKVASDKNCPSNPSHKHSPHEIGNC